MKCKNTIYTGPRAGEECGLSTLVVIATAAYTEQVCGYHARQYPPDCQYPLWANLKQLRRLQMANLDRLHEAAVR